MAGDGSTVGFPEAEFRAGIYFAMRMGSPNLTLDKATFRWDPVRTYDPQDPAARPYDWSAVPVTDLTQDDVELDEVAVEYNAGRTVEGTPVGQFVPLRATLTIFDEHRAQVVGANWVLLHRVPWAIIAETVNGLFAVDVYTLFLERQ